MPGRPLSRSLRLGDDGDVCANGHKSIFYFFQCVGKKGISIFTRKNKGKRAIYERGTAWGNPVVTANVTPLTFRGIVFTGYLGDIYRK